MPKFYFHLRDGETRIDDPEGIDLPNADAARAEGVQGARDMMAEMVRAGEETDGQVFEIWDSKRLVATAPFKDLIRLK